MGSDKSDSFALERWMPGDVVSESIDIEEKLFEVWETYIQVVGPSVVKAYRDGKLHEQPHEHVFHRVSERMQKTALTALIHEELTQDSTENRK